MNVRSIALDIYQKSLDSAYAGSNENIPELSAQDNAFVKRLVQTALRRQEFIKKAIRGYMTKSIPARPNIQHLIIILGTVEILYFRTPDYATVNSYVELAKKKGGKYCGGFVNAILRKVCRDRELLSNQTAQPFFPPAFADILRRDYSREQLIAIEQAARQEPDLDITVKDNPQKWAEIFNGSLLGNGSIRLHNAGNVSELPGYNEGCWWVQDFSSSLAVTTLGDIAGKSVLDLCAAPGGKTAQLICRNARVTALDISESRLQTMRKNLNRLQLEAAEIIVADALEYLKTAPTYDIVLLDAPCSATGTLRRHPEIVHNRRAEDIRTNSALQKELLAAAANAVASGGTLLYAVCSLSKAEGEKQIAEFLDSHPEFSVCGITPKEINPYNQSGFEQLITPEGYIRCRPDLLGGIDGFFVARLKKHNG